MDLISLSQLSPLTEYYSNRIELSIVHICPLDGQTNDSNCKRSVITTEHQTQQTMQTNNNNERKYLVVLLYGSYAKTPFKKSELKVGQTFSLKRFQTHLMPKNKAFKCDNGDIITNFYQTVVLVKSEYEPIIKMIVNSSHKVTETEDCNENVQQLNDNNSDDVMTKTNTTKTKENIELRRTDRHTFDDQYDDRNCDSNDETSESCLKSKDVLCNQMQKTTGNNKTVVKTHHISPKRKTSENNDLTAHTNQKYEYKKLLEIHNLQPVMGRTYVNLYGVLIKNDPNNSYIYLSDETVYSFEIRVLQCKTGVRQYPQYKTGDIIRIHRLLLKPNSIKECICMDPKDLVVFEAFKDCDVFNRLSCANECTIEEYDKIRKTELEEWFSNQLIEESLSELKRFGYVNIAAQLINVQTTLNRSLLHIWDSTQPSVKTCNRFRTNDIRQQCHENEHLISLITRNDLSLFLTVYDEHSTDATKLKPFDLIVIFNANIKDDQRNVGFSNIALNSTYRFGKRIRIVDNNSYLGKKLLTRIEEYKVISAVNTKEKDLLNNASDVSQLFPTQSQPLCDSFSPQTVNKNLISNSNTQMNLNLSDSDSDNLVENIVKLLEEQVSYLPSVIIVDIPDKSISIRNLLDNAIDKQLYKIQARVKTYLLFDDIKDVVSVLCTNQTCHHLIPLTDAKLEVIAFINDNKQLNCFRCKSTAKLFFKLCFIIEDTKHQTLTVELVGYDAQLFFNATPLQVLSQPEKLTHLKRVLKFLCANKCSSFESKSNNTLFNWIIQPSLLSSDPQKFIYRVRTVTQIEMFNKSVGINFNT